MFPFFPPVQPQGQQNRQLHTPQMPGFNNQSMIMPNQSHMIPSNPLQANIMGMQPMNPIAALQFSQVLNQIGMQQLCGQLALNGQMQNLNQFYNFSSTGQVWPQNFAQNLNQAMGFQGQYGPQNSVFPMNQSQQSSQNISQASRHTPFLDKSASDDGQVKSNGPNWPNGASSSPAGSNKMEDDQMDFQSGSIRPSQVSQYRNNNNGFLASPDFQKSPNGNYNRDHSQRRFQKHYNNIAYSKGYNVASNKNWGRGQQDGLERTSPFMKNTRRNPSENRRKPSTASTYSEEEIRQWREARRKNFPSAATVQRKLEKANGDSADSIEDTKLRRQQLKEVLAKQRELGFEAAEVPSSYLLDPEKQPQSRHGKRGRNGDKWQTKNQRPRTEPPLPPKQSLLRKLLSSEIKRDTSHLLQVFRFMTLNNFFDNSPEKPMEFPILTFGDGQVCRSGDDGDGQVNEKIELGEVSEKGACVTDERESSEDDSEGVDSAHVSAGHDDSR